MPFINLTPHPIVFVNGPTIPPSGTVARCEEVPTPAEDSPFEGVPLSVVVYGAPVGLPEPQPGVMLIVSALVRAAVPHRYDVASPGELVRGDNGAVVGCKGLVVNGGR